MRCAFPSFEESNVLAFAFKLNQNNKLVPLLAGHQFDLTAIEFWAGKSPVEHTF